MIMPIFSLLASSRMQSEMTAEVKTSSLEGSAGPKSAISSLPLSFHDKGSDQNMRKNYNFANADNANSNVELSPLFKLYLEGNSGLRSKLQSL